MSSEVSKCIADPNQLETRPQESAASQQGHPVLILPCRFMTSGPDPVKPSYQCYEHVIRALAADRQWSAAVGVYDHERRMHSMARFFFYAGHTHVTSKLLNHTWWCSMLGIHMSQVSR